MAWPGPALTESSPLPICLLLLPSPPSYCPPPSPAQPRSHRLPSGPCPRIRPNGLEVPKLGGILEAICTNPLISQKLKL